MKQIDMPLKLIKSLKQIENRKYKLVLEDFNKSTEEVTVDLNLDNQGIEISDLQANLNYNTLVEIKAQIKKIEKIQTKSSGRRGFARQNIDIDTPEITSLRRKKKKIVNWFLDNNIDPINYRLLPELNFGNIMKSKPKESNKQASADEETYIISKDSNQIRVSNDKNGLSQATSFNIIGFKFLYILLKNKNHSFSIVDLFKQKAIIFDNEDDKIFKYDLFMKKQDCLISDKEINMIKNEIKNLNLDLKKAEKGTEEYDEIEAKIYKLDKTLKDNIGKNIYTQINKNKKKNLQKNIAYALNKLYKYRYIKLHEHLKSTIDIKAHSKYNPTEENEWLEII